MLTDYPNFPYERVVAIPNGTTFCGEKKEPLLKSKYNLLDKRVLICVGRVYNRKNQRQLPSVFRILPEYIKNNIKILVCGKTSSESDLKEFSNEIDKNDAREDVVYIGSLDEEEIKTLYSVADGLIMPSLSEGLSLVAIEMLTYGKPVIMFSDNETAGDIYDEKVCVLAENHSDQALANAIVRWYENQWDEDYIKNYSKYYNMERVADDYIKYCKQRLNEGNKQ